MILLENVGKIVSNRSGSSELLSGTTLRIPSDRSIAFFASSLRDKREVMYLFTGLVAPTTGHVRRRAQLSFLVGHHAGFSPELSARQNTAHVARLYGADVKEIVSFVERAADCGDQFDEPYRRMSGTLRRHIAEIVGFTLPFDTYLLADELLPPDNPIRTRILALFEARLQTSGMIIPTQNERWARTYCDMGLVLAGGRLSLYEDLEEALASAPKLERAEEGTSEFLEDEDALPPR